MLSSRARHLLSAGVLLLIGATAPLSAQEQPRSRTWVSAGLGGGGGNNVEGMALTGQLVHQRGSHYLALRGLMLADPFGYSTGAGELGVMYGRGVMWRFGHAAVAAGVAYTMFDYCRPEQEECNAVGVPVIAEAAFRLLPVVGFGIQAFANTNTRASFGGVALFMQFGWLP